MTTRHLQKRKAYANTDARQGAGVQHPTDADGSRRLEKDKRWLSLGAPIGRRALRPHRVTRPSDSAI